MKAVEVIKKIAEDETKKLNIVEMGIVTSIFPHSDASDKDNYECNVKLKNRNLELRKVLIATQHIGFTGVLPKTSAELRIHQNRYLQLSSFYCQSL